MTMKKLAYSVQKQLQASTGVSFKRAHVYELLAASFGYSSYAGLGGEAVFTERSFSSRRPKTNALLVHERCLGLAYGSSVAKLVADSLPAFLTDSEIGIIKLADLVAYLQVGASSPGDDEGEMSAGEGDDWNVEDDRGVDSLALTSPILLEGLESAAQRGHALAHYALALIYGSDEDGQERETGSAYWYERAKSGWILSGVEKEWADAHALTLSQAEKHEQHCGKLPAWGILRLYWILLISMAIRLSLPVISLQVVLTSQGLLPLPNVWIGMKMPISG